MSAVNTVIAKRGGEEFTNAWSQDLGDAGANFLRRGARVVTAPSSRRSNGGARCGRARGSTGSSSATPWMSCYTPARVPRSSGTLVGMPDIFGVIADATRRDILQVLLEKHQHEGEISVSEIVSQLEISQPTVSKHLKVLREAELVTVREEGQHRYYSLDPEPLEMVEDFVIPFLSVGFDTEVTVEYLSEDGERLPAPDSDDDFVDAEVLSEEAAAAAERFGRAAARAENRVKELVARFKLRA